MKKPKDESCDVEESNGEIVRYIGLEGCDEKKSGSQQAQRSQLGGGVEMDVGDIWVAEN